MAKESPDTRQQILRAAQRRFANAGYAATAVQDIVDDAKVSKPALYYHFKDKAGLFQALVHEAHDERYRVLREASAQGGDIRADVSSLVAKVKQTAPKVEASPDLCCPTCKKPLQIRPDAYCCPDRHVYLNKQIAQRLMTIEEFKTLTSTGSVGPLEGFISKLGKPFAAKLIINEKGFPAFDFPPKEVPTKTLTIGQWKVSEGELFYAVEKKNLKFNIRRQIAQRPISENELEELLVNSKTPLLSNFISKAGRPFSAYLVLKNGGSVEFEFEPRPQNGALAGAR